MRGNVLWFAVALCLAPLNAWSQTLTAKTIHDFCRNRVDACDGFMVGAMEMYDQVKETPKLKPCWPKGATREQLAEVAKTYLTKHPEEWHLSASEVVLRAWVKAFPCP